MGDQEMVDYLARGLMDTGGPRPSIETLLHGFLPAFGGIRPHADAIVSLTNNDRCREVLTGVYGKDVIALAYRRPGFRISKEVADAIAEHPEPRAVVLERHGTITWGATVREAYEGTIELITRAEEAIAEQKRGRKLFGGPRVPVLAPPRRREIAVAVAPRLRGLLSPHRPPILTRDGTPSVTEVVISVDAPALSQAGPAAAGHPPPPTAPPCWGGAH